MLAVLLHVAGCEQTTSFPQNYTAAGSRTSSGNFSVSGGNLMARSGEPAVMFGTVTKPEGGEALSYVILFRLPAEGSPNTVTSESSAQSVGGGVDVFSAYVFAGHRVEAAVKYAPRADPGGRREETLMVGGQRVDPAAGRVFLLDLNLTPANYEQQNCALPEIPVLEKPSDVETFGHALITLLRDENPEVAAWLSGGEDAADSEKK